MEILLSTASFLYMAEWKWLFNSELPCISVTPCLGQGGIPVSDCLLCRQCLCASSARLSVTPQHTHFSLFRIEIFLHQKTNCLSTACLSDAGPIVHRRGLFCLVALALSSGRHSRGVISIACCPALAHRANMTTLFRSLWAKETN